MLSVIREQFSIVGSVWVMTGRIWRRYPVIFIPFLIIAFLEAVALTLAYLAPRPPLLPILGPPIRALFEFGATGSGEAFLHYPFNFLLLPRLLRIGQIIIGATVGVVLTALAVRMISQAYEGVAPTGRINLRDAIFRYFTLLIIWGVTFSLGIAASRGLPRLISGPVMGPIAFYLSLGIVVLIETLFAYGVVAIMLENQRAWRAIVRTLSLVRNIFLPTFILVLTPLILPILFIFIRGRIPQLMERFFPEITLYILGSSIIVVFLATCILRTSTVILYLVKREAEKAS